MGSSVVYNGLGGTSTSAISQAAVHRNTSAVASSTPAPKDFYKLFSMDQTKIEKRSLLEREENQVTDSGLVESLKFFDDFNHRGGRKSLRDFLGPTWLRTLERVQGVTIPDESEDEADLRFFLESGFNSPETFNIYVRGRPT